jgi:hypothetical protein
MPGGGLPVKNYLLMGRTGVGKSSFVNSTFDKPVAKVDAYRACTKIVGYYPEATRYGELCLIDTPGLAEAKGQHDDTYLTIVRDYIQDIAIEALIYVTPLNETRFRGEEQSSLIKITQHLGPAIWSSSWLTLTFAASVDQEDRSGLVDEYLREFDSLLSRIARPNGFLGGFKAFRNVLLVDNKVSDWGPTCRPLAAFLG